LTISQGAPVTNDQDVDQWVYRGKPVGVTGLNANGILAELVVHPATCLRC
jgi:hypothetical protein